VQCASLIGTLQAGLKAERRLDLLAISQLLKPFSQQNFDDGLTRYAQPAGFLAAVKISSE